MYPGLFHATIIPFFAGSLEALTLIFIFVLKISIKKVLENCTQSR